MAKTDAYTRARLAAAGERGKFLRLGLQGMLATLYHRATVLSEKDCAVVQWTVRAMGETCMPPVLFDLTKPVAQPDGATTDERPLFVLWQRLLPAFLDVCPKPDEELLAGIQDTKAAIYEHSNYSPRYDYDPEEYGEGDGEDERNE